VSVEMQLLNGLNIYMLESLRHLSRDKEQALALMDHYIGGIKAWLT
jgi:hypothetical protein